MLPPNISDTDKSGTVHFQLPPVSVKKAAPSSIIPGAKQIDAQSTPSAEKASKTFQSVNFAEGKEKKQGVKQQEGIKKQSISQGDKQEINQLASRLKDNGALRSDFARHQQGIANLELKIKDLVAKNNDTTEFSSQMSSLEEKSRDCKNKIAENNNFLTKSAALLGTRPDLNKELMVSDLKLAIVLQGNLTQKQFMELLSENPAHAVEILDQIDDRGVAEKFIESLCSKPENREVLTKFLVNRIREEVSQARNEQTLLRRTDINSSYFFPAFQASLLDGIKPLLSDLTKSPSDFYTPNQNPPQNISKITQASAQFIGNLDKAFSQPGALPTELKQLYQALKSSLDALRETKPEEFGKANPSMHLASFLFLTVINPRIATPQKYGLRQEKFTLDEQRGAASLSQAIQDCVNKYDGGKGKWDDALVDFVKEQHPRILEIAQKMAA